MAFIRPLSPKMSRTEMERRLHACKDVREALRWQAVMLDSAGRSRLEIAEICCRSRAWVTRTLRCFRELGADGLKDGRERNRRARLLSPEQEAELSAAIQGDSPDGGLWTGPKVAKWIAQVTGADDIDPSTGNNYLRRLGFSKQVPRPRHPGANKEAQEAFKKGGFKASLTTSFGPTRAPRSRSGPKTKRGSD